MREALLTSLALSALFICVYGGANAVSARREDIRAICFGWEHLIPFIPWMILPYLLLDLFFISAPFLCKKRNELSALRKRIVFAILFAGACFLIYPLKCIFPKPHVDGVLGWLFAQFLEMDKPYNQFPSLHIALSCILAEHYYRFTSSIIRIFTMVFFLLSALSTVFTYQHHFIDLVGGLVLGLSSLWLFPQWSTKWCVVKMHRMRMAVLYISGAFLFFFTSFLYRGWYDLLLWPGVSCTLIGISYWTEYHVLMRKRNGVLKWYSKLIFAPILVGQSLSLKYYSRQASPWNELTPHVWIGRRLTNEQANEAIRKGVTAILDLTIEFDESSVFRKMNYLNIPILDLTAPTKSQLMNGIHFIESNQDGGIVYIHCKAGYSRTAAMAGSWLVQTGRVHRAEEAIELLFTSRHGMVIRPEAEYAIQSMTHC